MSISKALIFKLSTISSLLLFLSIMYGQKFWSELWLVYGFIEFIIIVFFLTIFTISIVFWIKNKRNYSNSFIPFIINLIIGILVIVLPLNWIRNRIGFAFYYNSYQTASNLAINSKHDSTVYLYKLPDKFKSLSAGGGDALVINQPSGKAVFFYTFRGTPNGKQGFLKIIKGENANDFVKDLFIEFPIVKDLKNNWYYVSGD